MLLTVSKNAQLWRPQEHSTNGDGMRPVCAGTRLPRRRLRRVRMPGRGGVVALRVPGACRAHAGSSPPGNRGFAGGNRRCDAPSGPRKMHPGSASGAGAGGEAGSPFRFRCGLGPEEKACGRGRGSDPSGSSGLRANRHRRWRGCACTDEDWCGWSGGTGFTRRREDAKTRRREGPSPSRCGAIILRGEGRRRGFRRSGLRPGQTRTLCVFA